MNDLDKILNTVRELNRNHIKANGRTVQTWAQLRECFYCRRWIEVLLRRLESDNLVEYRGRKEGFFATTSQSLPSAA